MSKIALVVGNPFSASFSHALAESYRSGALESGSAEDIRVIDLAQAKFELSPQQLNGVRARGADQLDHLDAETQSMIATLEWADIITFIYPIWWGTYPTILKAFIDRTILSGVAFKYGQSPTNWSKLWRGKKARIILTQDAPGWWHKLVYRAPGENSLRWATLWYVGIKTLGVSRFTPVKTSTPRVREAWLARVHELGKRDARR